MPKPPSDDPRDVTKTVRLTRSEHEAVRKMIPHGTSFSDWVRGLMFKRGR
jgi:hypothetical protein